MTIGERLKKEREKKGYSLDDVHSRLRIHQAVLSNLEENNFQALPATIYTRGFLKRYSEFLEINPDELLTAFDGIADQKPQHQTLAIGLQNKNQSRLPEPPKTVLSAKRELIKKSPSSRAPLFRIGRGTWKVFTLVALIALAIFLMVRIAAVFSSWAGNLSLKPKTVSVSASSSASPAVTPTPTAAAKSSSNGSRLINSPQMGNFPSIKPKNPIKLAIAATTEAWIRVSSDGQVVFEAILRPGERKEWLGQNEFELKLGRPAGVSLIVNGHPLGSPGNGQARHITITRDGVTQHR